jgi:hypothetical protein
VCPGLLGLQKLVVHYTGTYSVAVLAITAGLPGLPLSTTDPRAALEAGWGQRRGRRRQGAGPRR